MQSHHQEWSFSTYSIALCQPCKPSALQKRSPVWTRICTPPETGNGQGKPSQALHTLNMTYANFSPLAGTAGYCVPKQAAKADTWTVSLRRPSGSRTLGRVRCFDPEQTRYNITCSSHVMSRKEFSSIIVDAVNLESEWRQRSDQSWSYGASFNKVSMDQLRCYTAPCPNLIRLIKN